jgi:hypothetical protein
VGHADIAATVRRHLGYTAAQVIELLTQRADALNLPIATRASLKTKLSRWENDKEQPSEIYQRLFREVYGHTNTELGFLDEPEEDPKQSSYAAGWPSPAPPSLPHPHPHQPVRQAAHIPTAP